MKERGEGKEGGENRKERERDREKGGRKRARDREREDRRGRQRICVYVAGNKDCKSIPICFVQLVSAISLEGEKNSRMKRVNAGKLFSEYLISPVKIARNLN